MSILFLMAAMLFSCPIFSAELSPQVANPSNVRIIPVAPTPEPDNVETSIIFPKENEVLSSSIVDLQIRLTGFPVGTTSDFERAKELYDDPNGQSLLIFIDNYHPIEIYVSFTDSLDQNNLYNTLLLTATFPYPLKQGMHVIRTFPDRSYGESLKQPTCYRARVFYVGKRENNLDVDLKGPYLTYNEPLETLRYNQSQPILLDFYLTNVQLSRDGYKVKVIIDKTVERILTAWVPYYIYGLAQGKHSIQLQLLDEKNQIVEGMFNDVKRIITVD